MTEPESEPASERAASERAASEGDEPSATAAKRAPAKKTAKKAAKKAPAKKAAKKNVAAKKTGSTTAKYPRHSLEKALRIPQAINDQNAGKPATRLDAVKFAGATALNGPWNVELSSAQKYGLLQPAENGQLALSTRARRIIAPQTETDRLSALREAIMDAPDFSDVYSWYRGEQLPEEQYFTNALTDRFHIPADKVAEFKQLFIESLRYAELFDESGPQPKVLDAGRTSGTGASAKMTPAGRAKVAAGANCFVMQPFAGKLGEYYELVFKPAIEQAGLDAVRADADIFKTGKIMDQVWRGINDATVLVAELTSKNPNVFYELGLAHALRKPVVLVSSNEEDVPFDLRHIRVIYYDQQDPFWGKKLIDKVADNIKAAIDDPEDAIFKIEAPS